MEGVYCVSDCLGVESMARGRRPAVGLFVRGRWHDEWVLVVRVSTVSIEPRVKRSGGILALPSDSRARRILAPH